MRIALAGNPNSGKTTMYNALTGKNEKVGNWAGVTVDKKEAPIKKIYSAGMTGLVAVDLPGAYSMSPFTSEESITSTYVKNENPDAIINIVDGTNLSRSLFFTTQLLELGIPVVVALNKSDINEKKETSIDVKMLSKKLGCPVIETIAMAGGNLPELMEAVKGVLGKRQIPPYVQGELDATNKSAVLEADKKRYAFVNSIVKGVEKRKVLTRNKNFQDKIDEILTNRWLGIPIFAVIMFLVFQISQAWLGPLIADGLVALIDMLGQRVGDLMIGEGGEYLVEPIFYSIIVDGIIGGVGAVVGFLPLVMVMYFLMAILEDCGYMARVSVVLAPIFKRVGLSGRSVIPFVVGTGCAIPGVMACRTIRDERERRATAMLAPFMPCGAKLPVIALFAGAFFGDATWVGTLMYFMGIVLIFLCALLINKISGHRPRKSFFIMEMPEYKAPSLARATTSMLQRGWSYIVKAGTIILVCNFAVQLMQSFTWTLQPATDATESILAGISKPFAYVIAPIVGVVAWQLAAAVITGFIAKENVVGTLAVCFVGLDNLIDTEELALMENAGESVAGVMAITKAAALAYLMFNLFSPPCFAAIGAMNAEIKNKKWLLAGVGIQLAVGYTLGFITYFFGSLFTGFAPTFKPWMAALGWDIVALIVIIFAAIIVKKNKEIKAK